MPLGYPSKINKPEAETGDGGDSNALIYLGLLPKLLAAFPKDVKTSVSTVSMSTARSEEHTSELQSRQYLVCRLLLEKKNPHHQLADSLPAYLSQSSQPDPYPSNVVQDDVWTPLHPMVSFATQLRFTLGHVSLPYDYE